MNRIYAILIILPLILLYQSVIAKEEFRVLATKGDISVQRNSSGNWDKLLTGNKLNKNDNVKLSQGSYLGLVHNNGTTVEVKEAGVFPVEKFSKVALTKKTSISNRIVTYISDEVQGSDDLLSKSDYRQDMGTTGAVERGLATDAGSFNKNSGSSVIWINSPKKINLLNPVQSFSWAKTPDAKAYEFLLTDRFDRKVFSKVVKDTMIVLNTQDLNLDKEVYYFWHVELKENPTIKSEDGCFSILSDKQVASINDSLTALKSELTDEKNAINNIVIAGFYEQNYILDEAKKYYKQAISLEPDVDEYQKIYKLFLKRSNINE